MTHIRSLVDVLARRVHARLYFASMLETYVFEGRVSVSRRAKVRCHTDLSFSNRSLETRPSERGEDGDEAFLRARSSS